MGIMNSNFNEKRRASPNSGLAKVAVQFSSHTFGVNLSLVLRINICGENRNLRKAAKNVTSNMVSASSLK